MPNTKCCMIDCDITSRTVMKLKDKSIKFHQFPKNDATFEQWVEACKNPYLPSHLQLHPRYRSHYHICSRHFHPLMYKNTKLKMDAFPTENLPPAKPTAQTVYFTNSIIKQTNQTTIRPEQVNEPEENIEDNDVLPVHELEKIIKIEDDEDEMNVIPKTVKDRIIFEDEDFTPRQTDDPEKKNKIKTETSVIEMLQQSLDASINKALEIKKLREKAEASINIREGMRTSIDPHSAKNISVKKHKAPQRQIDEQDITLEQFLKGCDKFLTPDMSKFVKSSILVNHTGSSIPSASTSELPKESMQIVTKKIYINEESKCQKDQKVRVVISLRKKNPS